MTWWPFAVGYALGSIPFAFLVARRVAGVDLRRAGSGNVGAANVLRLTRWSAGLGVALLDAAKGSAAVWLAGLAGGDTAARTLAGVGAVVGHVYPVWLRFQGGKGVATSGGAFLLLAPPAAALAAAAFLLVAWTTRYVSLGSVSAAVTLPAAAGLLGADRAIVGGALGAAALVVFRHRSNLGRLWRGGERRLGEKGG
jgi:glycerol-3-phosphate acyltransferase PlsY